MAVAIKAENISKQYRLGVIGTGTLSHDLNRWWAKIRGKDDPTLKIGQANTLNSKNNADDYVWALKDINFEIQQGEAVGIIGKNGAGKSTLLKILSKVTGPTTGSIKVKGRIASLLEVGTGFHPELTGRENIFLNGAILGMTKAEIRKKFDEIVDFSGVEKYIDTPVKRYSSGMYVRLAFAVAAHLEPEILVVDEVLAVGDAEFQKKCLGKMKDVSANEGRTVLFVSHNMGAIQNFCTKSVLLKNGKIIRFDKTSEVIHSYLSNFTSEQKKVAYSIENAPGNNEVRLLNAEIITKKEPIEAGDSIQFLFEFAHQSEEEAVYDITFHLIDEMNNLVFVGSTGYLDTEKSISQNGKYVAKCTIPYNLMNTGTFTINRLLYVRNRGQLVFEWRDILSFEVIEKTTGALGWYGNKEGVVRPWLDWEIKLPK